MSYLSDRSPESIINDEARVHTPVVQNTTLYKEGNWPVLEKWGVKKVSEEGLCYTCILPEGWKKVKVSDSPEESDFYLIDGDGLVRAKSSFEEIIVYEHRYGVEEHIEEADYFAVYEYGQQTPVSIFQVAKTLADLLNKESGW